MIYLRDEGEIIRNGLNLYHLNDKSSIGGTLRVGRLFIRARWSKVRRRLHVGVYRASKAAMLLSQSKAV